MQTAEEIFYKFSENYTGTGVPPSKLTLDAMKEYAKQACERQKVLCLINWVDCSSEGCLSDSKERNYILSAPFPDLK